MAGIKIVNLPALGRNLASTDLFELSLAGGTGSRKITGQEIISAIPSGITIGTTAITSGTVGRVLFEGTGNVVQESANLFWDNTNARLGVGTSSPISKLHIVGDTNIIYQQASTTGFTGKLYYAFKSGGVSGEAMSLFGDFVGGVASAFAFSNASGTTIMQIRNGGNVQIGTTTDAGFKLDVNGTARVSGQTTLTGTISAPPLFMQLASYGDLIKTSSGAFSLVHDGGGSISFTASDAFNLKTGTFNHIKGVWNSNTRHLRQAIFGSDTTNTTSSIVEIVSTTQGFLPPRMTQAQRNAIASPAIGLEIYQTDATEGKYIYKSSGWTYIG